MFHVPLARTVICAVSTKHSNGCSARPSIDMIGLIQRVRRAEVDVDGQCVGKIGQGLLALIGVQASDEIAQAEHLLQRLLSYRVFADSSGRMNLSLTDIQGGLLLVPQFTLAADTRKGRRPGFSTAASPERAESLFNHLVESARKTHASLAEGRFGSDMQVSLINDGPVTFWLET